jgi:type IV fimbrial biogenesis protein FimT
VRLNIMLACRFFRLYSADTLMNVIRFGKFPARRQPALGFTLPELLVTMAVMAILLGAAVPAVTGFVDRERVTAVAEQVYVHMSQARAESVARSAPIFMNFAAAGNANWTYGMSGAANCTLATTDPTAAGACVIAVDDGDGVLDPGDGSVDTGDLLLMRSPASDHPGVVMSIANFSSGNTNIQFDPVRGTSTAGDVLLTSPDGTRRLSVRLSLLGQARICSPDGSVGGYSTVNC